MHPIFPAIFCRNYSVGGVCSQKDVLPSQSVFAWIEFYAFCKKHCRRIRSLLRAKREPERTAVPAGHESPSGAFKPQTGLQSKCRVFSAARSPLLSRRGRRSSPLQIRGCSPLVTPKQKGSIQKIQVAPLEDFLCYADLQSLRDGDKPTAANAVCRYDPSCENAMPGGPQTARHCSIINNSSADDAQSKAARILNRHAVVRLPAVRCRQRSAPQGTRPHRPGYRPARRRCQRPR